MEYLPFNTRWADSQYQRLLKEILDEGEPAPTRQGPDAITLMQCRLQYDLRNGFPLIPDRDMSAFWRKPIGELCAFINGATTVKELEAFGCDWWGPWATEAKTGKLGLAPGDLGPASYGGAFRHWPVADQDHEQYDTFDQFANLVRQLKELPDDRRHFITPWIPDRLARGHGFTPGATIAPCHGWIHVRVLSGFLHLHMFQRSGDVPVGVPANMVQYAALMLMLEHLTGFTAGTYYHTISDAHIYEDQVVAVQELLTRRPRRLPIVRLNHAGRQVADIHDFRAEHFEADEYLPHPALKIAVSV